MVAPSYIEYTHISFSFLIIPFLYTNVTHTSRVQPNFFFCSFFLPLVCNNNRYLEDNTDRGPRIEISDILGLVDTTINSYIRLLDILGFLKSRCIHSVIDFILYQWRQERIRPWLLHVVRFWMEALQNLAETPFFSIDFSIPILYFLVLSGWMRAASVVSGGINNQAEE
jgi:hypothetical protein